MVDLMFGVFGAAMFAEPAVADIEEVIGLIHGQKGVGCRVLGVGFANLIRRSKQCSLNPAPNPHTSLAAARIRRFCQTHRH